MISTDSANQQTEFVYNYESYVHVLLCNFRQGSVNAKSSARSLSQTRAVSRATANMGSCCFHVSLTEDSVF